MKMRLLIIIALAILIAGCAQNTKQYLWGNYSQTLYEYKKNPSDITLTKHIDMLQKIVSASDKYKMRVPPGIYSELAYMKKLQDPSYNVTEMLNLEKRTYPESEKFIDFINRTLFNGGTDVEN
jgi:hypothetical protein